MSRDEDRWEKRSLFHCRLEIFRYWSLDGNIGRK